MPSQFSPPEWLSELIALRDNRDRSLGEWPPARDTDYGHFVAVYWRIAIVQCPYRHAPTAPPARAFIRNSLNSRILYASQGRPVALKHLEEVWNIFITEKLIS